MRILMSIVFMFAMAAAAEKSDKADKAERKAEHQPNKIVSKVKDKSGNWKTEREFPLMFDIADKASKHKTKKVGKK